MVNFTKPFFPLLLAILLSSCAQAAPWPSTIKHATHRVHQTRAASLASYHPASVYKTFEVPVPVSPITGHPVDPDIDLNGTPMMANLRNLALSYIRSEGVDPATIVWGSGALFPTMRIAYLKQSVNGITVANTAASVAFNINDEVVTYSTSFVRVAPAGIADPIATFQWQSIFSDLEKRFNATLLDGSAVLQYVARDDGSLALAHAIQLRNLALGTWYEVFVDAHKGGVLSVNNFAADASYTVVPADVKSVAEMRSTIMNPLDSVASPQGWHDGDNQTAVAAGNNARVFVPGQDTPLSQSSAGLNFNYFYDGIEDPNYPGNQNAARGNAFYVANMVHDVAYRYGFTEDKFNFQLNNFAKGGKENDPVLLTVQDTSNVNQIGRFVTPPDGMSPIGKIYLWDSTNPRRDGAMENDILIHELAHGITNRLTGGGSARCLQTTMAAGLGEGWSDMYANWFQQTSSTAQDFSMGSYVTNVPRGIRTFPYSTDQKINTLKYRHLASRSEPHHIGEVWATMLHDVYASLIAFKSPATTEHKFTNFSDDNLAGNIVFMTLFMDSLSLQPCNPTFLDTRAAWFAADRLRYGGKHRCLIGKAFAGRGFGEKADNSFQDDDTIPDGCF